MARTLRMNQIQDCFWEAALGVMKRLVSSEAVWNGWRRWS